MRIDIARINLSEAQGRIEFSHPTRIARVRVALSLFGSIRIAGPLTPEGCPGAWTASRARRGVFTPQEAAQLVRGVSWAYSDARDIGRVALVATTLDPASEAPR